MPGITRWLPTSKMTGVFLAGTMYAVGVTVLQENYGVLLNPIDVSWNMLWFVFLAGYGATENRPTPLLEQYVLSRHGVWDKG